MRAFQAFSLLLSISSAIAAPTPTDEVVADIIARQAATCTTGITAARKAQVQSAFTASGVVPTLIPSINPVVDVRVSYGAKAVNLGNTFKTTETLNQPSLSFTAESGKDAQKTTYSYFLVDPDVPNPAAGALRMTYLHWEVSGAKSICATSQSPKTVAMYQALTPLSTQQHRYTFLVYREPPNYQPEAITPQLRSGFNVNTYAARGGLTLVGGNFLREAITN